MIKINLSKAKNQVDISNIGGFDFTKLKIKAVLLVIFLIYVPDLILVPMWEEERMTLDQQVNQKQARLSSLKRKVSQSQDLERQIKELKAQEENLEKKLAAVKQAISAKKSVHPILLYISKNIPADLWIKYLEINETEMVIKGEALDYVSIGNFVNALKSSVFIKEANIAGTSSSVRETDKRRIESFEVKFVIASFEQ
jgi:Tfp pilus assembly protein PilN